MGNRMIEYAEIGLCNCSSCGCECIGERTQFKLQDLPKYAWPPQVLHMPVVRVRLDGRPICSDCCDRGTAGLKKDGTPILRRRICSLISGRTKRKHLAEE